MNKVIVTEGALYEVFYQRIQHIMKKNHDYGDAWQENGPFTPLMRIREKLIRVETLSDGRQALVLDEDVDTNVAEVLDYAALWLLWRKYNQPYRQTTFAEWLRSDLAREKLTKEAEDLDASEIASDFDFPLDDEDGKRIFPK